MAVSVSEPTRWRKVPVVVEAMQLMGYESAVAIKEWVGPQCNIDRGDATIAIHTLEGIMVAAEGDWIIRGVQGEFYPCKPDIFEMTYEAAE